jgi:hypothetical protein
MAAYEKKRIIFQQTATHCLKETIINTSQGVLAKIKIFPFSFNIIDAVS